MTPQEKAKELYDKYFMKMESGIDNDGAWICMALNHGMAKSCALIAVDEIMNIKGNLNFDYVWYEQRETDINNWLDTESIVTIRMHALEYWQQVKQEIEKI